MEQIEHCTIDLDEQWVNSFKDEVEAIQWSKEHPEPRTIFRIPASIRESDPSAYEPKLISFGPYHRNSPSLRAMDALKLRYLGKILRRNPGCDLEEYLRRIKGLEARARSCYAEEIDMDSNEFTKLMLLDGCFIVQFIMQVDEGLEEDEDDEYPNPTNIWMRYLITIDILLLENQLPFFVLQSLFELATAQNYNKSESFVDLTIKFFSIVLPYTRNPSKKTIPRCYHFLHLIHSCLKPLEHRHHTENQRDKPFRKKMKNICAGIFLSFLKIYKPAGAAHRSPEVNLTPEIIPCATELKEAGVKFRSKEAAGSFLEVEFGDDGILGIPPLHLYDETNSLFRNLIALEMCYPLAGNHMSAYALFMDCLTDTRRDVALLHRKKVLVNCLGSDDAAALVFNRLCKDVIINMDSSYLSSLYRDVRTHCDSRWNKNRAKLMHDYFSNPWSALSLAGALILLLLTIIQSVCALIPHF